MVSKQPDEKGQSAVPQKSKLTQAYTAIVTQARMKSVRMREEPELPKNNSVSLLVTDGASKGMSFPVQKPQVVIGRTTGDIVIADSKVSSIHCVVEVHGPSALLVDLESGNGTFVRGKKVVSSELDHMSEFRVGKTTLMFVITGRY
jgi:pSer/pThr/pTyr-binding forkhead associated (FHA) protein